MSLTTDQLKELSKDIAYEIFMLYECVSQYGKLSRFIGVSHYGEIDDPDSGVNTFQENLLIEGIAIHSRVLISFLFNTPNKPSDVNAISYFDKPADWKTSNKPQLLEDTVIWSNKRLAHMTKQRLDPKPTINFSDVCRVLVSLLDKFIELAPQDRISDELRNWGDAQQYRQ